MAGETPGDFSEGLCEQTARGGPLLAGVPPFSVGTVSGIDEGRSTERRWGVRGPPVPVQAIEVKPHCLRPQGWHQTKPAPCESPDQRASGIGPGVVCEGTPPDARASLLVSGMDTPSLEPETEEGGKKAGGASPWRVPKNAEARAAKRR